MAKKLDLRVFQEEYFELTLLDGTVIHLRKPTQAIMLKLMEISTIDKKDAVGILAAFVDVVATILGNNREGRKFAAEDIADYGFAMQKAIIETYTEFANEVMADPN